MKRHADGSFPEKENPGWLHPRQTDSALMHTAAGETEKYLFYRGIGKFEPPVTFTASAAGGVRAVNHGTAATGEIMVLENAGGQARWMHDRFLSAYSRRVEQLRSGLPETRK